MIECTLGLTVKNYAPTVNRLKTIACNERPQERLETFGAAALSDTELLAILLRSGTHGYDVLTLASRLIAEAGSLARLAAWNEADFRRLKGIGRVKGGQLVAMMEIARRVIGKAVGRRTGAESGGPGGGVSAAVHGGTGGGEILGVVPQPKEPADEAGGGDKRNGDVDLGASARSVPRGDPGVGLRDRCQSLPSIRRPFELSGGCADHKSAAREARLRRRWRSRSLIT